MRSLNHESAVRNYNSLGFLMIISGSGLLTVHWYPHLERVLPVTLTVLVIMDGNKTTLRKMQSSISLCQHITFNLFLFSCLVDFKEMNGWIHTSNEWQFIFSHQRATVNCSQSRLQRLGHERTLKGEGRHYGARGYCQHQTHYWWGIDFYPRDAMLARVIGIATCLVRPSVRPSVTRRYWHCVKAKKTSVMISSPSSSPMILVLWRQISSPNSKGFPPNGGLK